jgi:serine/threonine protein kinase
MPYMWLDWGSETITGRVKLARHISTGEYAAVKIVSKQALITSRMSMSGMTEQADKILLSIEREIVLMKLIDHPNVLSLYDVWETSNELHVTSNSASVLVLTRQLQLSYFRIRPEWRIVRPPSLERTTIYARGSRILPANNICRGLLSSVQDRS